MMVDTLVKPETEMPSRTAATTSEPASTRIGTLTLSRDFDKIVEALGTIQASINDAGLTAEARNETLNNPYASLPAILKALTPHLKEHGITLLQPYEAHENTVCVTTIFIKGKQFASMSASMKAESPHPHSIGSAITYCCRYSIRAMLGLAVEGPGDQDDDGNRASGVGESAGQAPSMESGRTGIRKLADGTDNKETSAPSVKSSAGAISTDPAGYSDALRGYLKRVETADLAGLTSAESQVPAFKLSKDEQEILLKAIRDRKAALSPASTDEA